MKVKASVLQMTSGPDVMKNLTMAAELIKQAADQASKLVVLPEMFPIMGAEPQKKVQIAEAVNKGPIQEFLKSQAKSNKIWIVGGTIPIQTADSSRVRSACFVYDGQGNTQARYDKLHLFDVCVTKDVEEYKESATIEPGESVTVIDTPIGRMGLCVCYDLRFPLLFQEFIRQGVEIIAVPTAFTVKTGQAHWEILTRTRCIDIQAYGLFSCQVGRHGPGKTTYGHSMIIDPWGEILGDLSSEPGIVTRDIDLEFLQQVRRDLPVLEHQRSF